jgi:hypothetical protein
MSENVENKASNSGSKPTKVGAMLQLLFFGSFNAYKVY